MNVREIPFVEHVGIAYAADSELLLSSRACVHNHVGTVHAAALFALAETQSGLCLQTLFAGDSPPAVLPLLRSSAVKYHAPANSAVHATASVSPEGQERFATRFERKGRATVAVTVTLSDDTDTLVMSGEFSWFVQKID